MSSEHKRASFFSRGSSSDTGVSLLVVHEVAHRGADDRSSHAVGDLRRAKRAGDHPVLNLPDSPSVVLDDVGHGALYVDRHLAHFPLHYHLWLLGLPATY